jgi:hypothetical protein
LASINLIEVQSKAIAARAAVELNPNNLGGPSTYEMLAYLATAIEQFSSSSSPGGSSQGKLNQVGAATLASGNNLLNLVAGSNSIDLSSFTQSFNSLTFQLTTPAAPSSGQIVFEGSNDNVNFVAIRGIEEQFAWSNVTYSEANYPLATFPSTGRIFTIPLKQRYVRLRIATTLSAAITCHQVYSSNVFQLPVNGFPAANNILKVSSNGVGTTNNLLLAAPGAGLRIYFCGAVIADGGAGGTIADWWISDGNGPGGARLAVFSRRTTDPESGNIVVSNPIPLTPNTLLDLYNNGGANNAWTTVTYFIAP